MGLQITSIFNHFVPVGLRGCLYVVHPSPANGESDIGFTLFNISTTVSILVHFLLYY